MLKVDILCRLPTPPPSTCSSSCASWPSSPPSSSLPSSTSSTCSSGQSVKTIFQLSFAGNTTQQYLLSPTNIQYSLVRNCTNQQWFSKSNLQKTEASRSSEGSGNARLCDIFSWGCICLLFSWYIFYHWKNFRVCALSWSQLQTLNDMTRSMTAPLVHIKKLAKASNVKVGFRLHLDISIFIRQASSVLPSSGEEVVLNEGPKNPTQHRFLIFALHWLGSIFSFRLIGFASKWGLIPKLFRNGFSGGKHQPEAWRVVL